MARPDLWPTRGSSVTGRESGQGWLGTSSRGHSLRGRLTCQRSLGCLGRPLYRPSPPHSAPDTRSRPQQGVAVGRACQPELLSGGPSLSAAALTHSSKRPPSLVSWAHTPSPAELLPPLGQGPEQRHRVINVSLCGHPHRPQPALTTGH